MTMIDLTGKTFGNILVLSKGPTIIVGITSRQRKLTWNCRCICGRELIIQGQSLRYGNTTSCGCLGNHERSYPGTREQKIWRAMIYRCHNPKAHNYYKYGAKGVTVCRKWQNSFDAFLADVGYCPSKAHSIDRIKAHKGYTPGNVRWATYQEQGRNKRR